MQSVKHPPRVAFLMLRDSAGGLGVLWLITLLFSFSSVAAR